MLANLLTNAAKYTPPEGCVSLDAWREGDCLAVRVTDDGVGIEPEMLPQMFELFIQGPRAIDRAEGGLGIGLTLVRSLVQLHGGTVEARSEGPGRGTEIVVRLPARTAAVPQPAEPSSAPCVEDAAPPLAVLVVDDNEDAAELMAELLQAAGHEVEVAHDGAAALSHARRRAPQVAVLDIGLPVMDGYELAASLRTDLGARAPRMIAVTGYGQEHDRARSERAGFAAHLVKPVDPARLVQLVAQGAEASDGHTRRR